MSDEHGALVEVCFDRRHPTRLRFHSWERDLLVERFDGEAWEPLHGDPGFVDLLAKGGAEPMALEPIRASLPAETAALAERYRVHGLSVLRLLRTGEGAELVRSAPNLVWLVAAALGEGTEPSVPLEELVCSPRRALLSFALGLEQTSAAMVRFAERIEIDRFDAERLAMLRSAIRRSDIREAATRLRRFQTREILLMVRMRGLVTNPYLRELLERIFREGPLELLRVQNLMRDILDLARDLRHPSPEQTVRSAKTLDQLERLHDRLMERYLHANPPEEEPDPRARHPDWPDVSELPPPPYPGSNGIVPLRTPLEVEYEGRAMRHCVGVYVDRILRGECAIYRVLEPHRATLELDLMGPEPRIAQLVGLRNARGSSETREAVERWLANQRDQTA